MKSTLFTGLTFLLLACNTSNENKNVNGGEKKPAGPGDLNQSANQTCLNQVREKDSIINSLFQAFNEIQENLNVIKSKEKIVSLNVKDPELTQSSKDRIKSDIELIYGLLNKNRYVLTRMNEKLKDSTLRITQLEKFIMNLRSQMDERENEVGSLKKQVGTLKIELDYLNISATKTQKESDSLSAVLNKAYFAIGTNEMLKKEGLIIEKGGIIGIGKVTEMDPNLKKDLFNSVNMYETPEISIAAKKVKLIGIHPSDSYRLEDTKLGVKKLFISDPASFWNTSKYLIIEVSNDKPSSHDPKEGLSGSTETTYK